MAYSIKSILFTLLLSLVAKGATLPFSLFKISTVAALKVTSVGTRLPAASSRLEGGWSGGGGTGIACWTDIEDAKQARLARSQKLQLPQELYERIKTLEVTDYWEHREKLFIKPFLNENSGAYLKRVLNLYFLNAAPSFNSKLEYALRQVGLNDEQLPVGEQTLSQIEDTGPIKNYNENDKQQACSVVQIATRYARTVKGKIETEFFLDQKLYNKLGLRDGILQRERQTINQAMLRSHEALYLVGYSLNQSTSEKVRSMTSYLVLQESLDIMAKVVGLTYAISPTESSLSGLQKFAVLFILSREGFGEVPYTGLDKIPSRKLQFKDSYKKYQADFVNLHRSVDELNFSDAVKSEMKSAAIAVWLSGLNGSDAFIGASLALMMADQVGDFYLILDPELDTSLEEKKICYQIDDWLARHPEAQRQNAVLTVKMFQNARQYCKSLTKDDYDFKLSKERN
jgi:hypothetical protein